MKGDNLLAFISGAVIGAAAAILFAPSSGKETREKLKDNIDKEYKSFKDKVMNEACSKENDVTTSDKEKENVEEDERDKK